VLVSDQDIENSRAFYQKFRHFDAPDFLRRLIPASEGGERT